jgi:hypothetical protein
MGESKRKRAAGTPPRREGKTGLKLGRTRLTWRVVVLFLVGMLVLDIVLYAVLRFGFDSCYGLLCLLE